MRMIIINHRYRLIRLICVQDSEIVIEKVDTIRYNKIVYKMAKLW